MGIYIRPDSPFYWLRLDGYVDERGNPLRERTRVRSDATDAGVRRDNERLAKKLYHARMAQLAADTSGLPGAKPIIMFEAFADWWEAHELPRRRGQADELSRLARLRAFFSGRRLQSIDRALVAEYATWRRTTPTRIAAKKHVKARIVKAGNSTINREIDTLKAILQAAVPKYLEASPIYGMKRLHAATPKRRNLADDEEGRLLAAMSPEDRALFLFGLDTLTRLKDILGVRRKDIVNDDRAWIADPKTGEGYYVALSTRVQTAIAALPAGKPNDYLFAHRRGPKTEHGRRNGVKRMLERACKDAEPPVPYGRNRDGIVFHWATRRTGATRMLRRGVPLATVMKTGHWKDPKTVTDIYHEIVSDDERAAVEAVAPVTPASRETKAG